MIVPIYRRTILSNNSMLNYGLWNSSRSFSFSVNDDHLSIEHDNNKHKFYFQWLRDHCRDSSVYNNFTNQRSISLLQFSPDVKPLEIEKDNNSIRIKWNDNHKSTYDMDWLMEYSFPNRKTAYKPIVSKYLWDRSSFPYDKATVDHDTFMNTHQGIYQAIKNIIEYGFTIVKGVDKNAKATAKVVERITPIGHTMYGGLVDISDMPEKANDSAYDNGHLGLHTDLTYFSEAMGLQVFHLLKPAEKWGGENLLLDGFKMAELLKSKYPDVYEYFSKNPIESDYVNNQNDCNEHFSSLDYVFKHHPVTNELQQVRYNIYDRGVHRMSMEEQKEFYKNIRVLASMIENKDLEVELMLDPGNVIFIDNWRVMHGRNAFEGKRHMISCYAERSYYNNLARVFKLVH